MSDRVPLQEEKVEESVQEEPSKPEFNHSEDGIPKEDPIQQFNDKRLIATMLGFKDYTFDGMGREMDRVYKWAKEVVGEPTGEKVMEQIAELRRTIGTNNKGAELLKKMYHWVIFDTQQRELDTNKRSLEDGTR